MTDQPSPFLPSEVDLRGYEFMPLHVTNLRQSAFAARVSGDEYRAGTMLWAASWHELPAGSVPDDDYELAKLAGYGFAVDVWKKLRGGALYGFTLCSDGRLYHRVVCAVAWDSWLERLKYHWGAECDRIRAHNKRVGDNEREKKPIPTLAVYVRGQYPQTARRMDELDRLNPPQGWLAWVDAKKRVRRTRLVRPPDTDGESAGRGAEIGGPDTLYIGAALLDPPTVHRTDPESPDDNALKGEGRERLPPPSPPDRGGDLVGLPEGFEGRRGADFLSFYADWGDATVPIATAARAWCEVEPDIPPRERLIAALGEFKRLNAAKAKGAKHPPPQLGIARFLRERQWGPLLATVDQANAGALAKLALFRQNWGDLSDRVLGALGEPVALAWLSDAKPRMVDGCCIIAMRHRSAINLALPRVDSGLRRALPGGFEMVVA